MKSLGDEFTAPSGRPPLYTMERAFSVINPLIASGELPEGYHQMRTEVFGRVSGLPNDVLGAAVARIITYEFTGAQAMGRVN